MFRPKTSDVRIMFIEGKNNIFNYSVLQGNMLYFFGSLKSFVIEELNCK